MTPQARQPRSPWVWINDASSDAWTETAEDRETSSPVITGNNQWLHIVFKCKMYFNGIIQKPYMV
jgi:hypothetical protein